MDGQVIFNVIILLLVVFGLFYTTRVERKTLRSMSIIKHNLEIIISLMDRELEKEDAIEFVEEAFSDVEDDKGLMEAVKKVEKKALK